MIEYTVTFIFDYAVMICNPVESEDEVSAIQRAEEFVKMCGVDIDYANYGVDVEEV